MRINKTLFWQIWVLTILIILMGLVALYSASYDNIRVTQKIFYDQLYCAGISLGIMYLISKFDFRHFYEAAWVFYALNIVLLLWVMFGGRDALGARRWMDIGGISFQPSELTKIAIILVLARFYSQRHHRLAFGFFNKVQAIWHDLVLPIVLTVVPMFLIFKQPDLGTSLLIMGIFMAMAFGAGISKRIFFSFLGVCLFMVPFGWHFLHDYQKDRLLVFLNPNIDPLGAGYTIIQSKIAVGSGQMWGKGWLSGTQNQLNFLPERHTDFIFSVIGEEWGLLGTGFLLLLYFLLIHVGFELAKRVKDKFARLVTIGIITIFTLQVIINIGMVIGLFPIVGLTLPLASYGRTSFIVFIIMLGFLLNVCQKRTLF